RFRGHAAEGDAGGTNRAAADLETDGGRREREFVCGSIADLEIRRAFCVRRVRDEHGRDQLAALEIVLGLRRRSRQEMEVGRGHVTVAARTVKRQDGIERGAGYGG